jgi:hypothetical protein
LEKKKTTSVIFPLKKHTRAVFLFYLCFYRYQVQAKMSANPNLGITDVVKTEPPGPLHLNEPQDRWKLKSGLNGNRNVVVSDPLISQCDNSVMNPCPVPSAVSKTEHYDSKTCYDLEIQSKLDQDIVRIKTEPCDNLDAYRGHPLENKLCGPLNSFDVISSSRILHHNQGFASCDQLSGEIGSVMKTEFLGPEVQGDVTCGKSMTEFVIKSEFDPEDPLPGIHSLPACSDVRFESVPAESGSVIVKVEEVQYESVLEQGTVEFNLTSDVDTASTEMIIKMEGAGDDVIPKQEADLHHFGTDVPRGMLKIEVDDPLHPVPSRDVKLEEDEEENMDHFDVKTESTGSESGHGADVSITD